MKQNLYCSLGAKSMDQSDKGNQDEIDGTCHRFLCIQHLHQTQTESLTIENIIERKEMLYFYSS